MLSFQLFSTNSRGNACYAGQSRIWSGAVIGQSIISILFAIVHELQTKHKRSQKSTVNATNLLQNSQNAWNIYILLQRKHLSFAVACWQKNTKLNYNPMTTRLQLFGVTQHLRCQKRFRVLVFFATSIKPLPQHPLCL